MLETERQSGNHDGPVSADRFFHPFSGCGLDEMPVEYR